MRTNKSKSTDQPKQRILKIHPKFRLNTGSSKVVPEIKLCGNWLMDAGFEQGANVVVTSRKNKLIIERQYI